MVSAGLPSGPDDEDLRVLYEAAGYFRDNPRLGEEIRALTARQVELYERLLVDGAARGVFRLASDVHTIARNLVALEDAYGLYIIGGAPMAEEARRLILSFASLATGCELEGGGADEAGVDRHRLLGRLAEVEALAEVDAELGHRAELVDALDALGDDLGAELVRAVDQRLRPARGGPASAGCRRSARCRSWRCRGAAARGRRSESGPPERSSRATSAPRLRCAATISCSRSRSGQRSGLTISRQIRDGSAPRRPTTGQVVRSELSTSSDRARVEVDEQDLALGQQRQPDLERRGAGAVVEGEERVVGLGGGDQLAAAQLDRAELAAHQRLAAEGAAGRAGRRSAGSAASSGRARGTRGTSRCACGPAASRPAPAAPARRPGGRRTGRRARRATARLMTAFSRSSQPGPASSESFHGDVARRRARWRGARPCRARTAGARAVARHPWRRWRGSRPSDRPLDGRGLYSDEVVDRALVGQRRPGRRSRARPRRAPTRRRARRRSASAPAASRPPARRARPPRAASDARAGRRARAAAASPRSAAGRCRAANVARARRWARSRRENVKRAPSVGELDGVAGDEVRDRAGSATRELAERDVVGGVVDRRASKATSMWSARHRRRRAHSAANASRAPGGASSRGRGGSVPGRRHGRLLARRVAQPGGERHEVEDVVGVQVADHDRVDVDVVDGAAQLGEHARAAVEQHGQRRRPRRDSPSRRRRRPARRGTCPAR